MSGQSALGESFGKLAGRYDRHAALAQEIGKRLLDRMDFLRSPPERIVDLGCGTGSTSAALKKRFRKSQVISFDLSPGMLRQAQDKSTLLRPLKPVCGDMGALPFATRSVDLMFSNLASFWYPEPERMFAEFRRVLRPQGMLLFSTLGPDSLSELRTAWSVRDADIHVPHFADLLELGDALMAAGFGEPVMDVERVTLHYPGFAALADELDATGLAFLLRGWERDAAFDASLEAAYETQRIGGKYPLSFEIVVGTAFGPAEGQPRKTPAGDVVTFSVESLLKSRR
ncbi:MAG: methyltransferase domain-containing protein [Xanthomonadales bacterium]|nr:methyltransferase domain-containing protein [Xanthomonadales bacterium]